MKEFSRIRNAYFTKEVQRTEVGKKTPIKPHTMLEGNSRCIRTYLDETRHESDAQRPLMRTAVPNNTSKSNIFVAQNGHDGSDKTEQNKKTPGSNRNKKPCKGSQVGATEPPGIDTQEPLHEEVPEEKRHGYEQRKVPESVVVLKKAFRRN